MIELLRTNDPVLVSFIASVLADAKIAHSVADSHMSAIEGSISAVQNRVLVAEGELDRAREVLTEAGVDVKS